MSEAPFREPGRHTPAKYVRENPVRAGLAARPEDWLYFGRVHEIRWSGD